MIIDIINRFLSKMEKRIANKAYKSGNVISLPISRIYSASVLSSIIEQSKTLYICDYDFVFLRNSTYSDYHEKFMVDALRVFLNKENSKIVLLTHNKTFDDFILNDVSVKELIQSRKLLAYKLPSELRTDPFIIGDCSVFYIFIPDAAEPYVENDKQKVKSIKHAFENFRAASRLIFI